MQNFEGVFHQSPLLWQNRALKKIEKFEGFVRSGGIYLTNSSGATAHAGRMANYGSFWSSRGDAATHAYDLDFITTSVSPSAGSIRWYGFPLRCLSTVLGMGRSIKFCAYLDTQLQVLSKRDHVFEFSLH